MRLLRGRSAEELIIVGAALVCLCGQIPYGLYRLSIGHWWVAGIDFFGAAVCMTAIYQVLKHRRTWYFGAIMSLAAVFGVLAIVRAEGVGEAPFIFPVAMLAYFLIRPIQALLLSGIASIGLAIILRDQLGTFELTKIVLSLIGCSLFAYLFATIRNQQNKQLQRLSTRDALTGALNRRSLDERLDLLILQSQRQPLDSVLIILDCDNFKQINDRDGHLVGDAVLKRVVETISERIRATDELYRFGGDEFVVIVNDSSLELSLGLAEDLRTKVEAIEAMEGTKLSISLGVSAHEPGQSSEQWLASADQSLLQAKARGRNVVVSSALQASA